ncbi:hypothetical protein PF005_g23936 [Phytophthora fragariae]|uniref:Uncharacterized protein n=1 Tax=Phytophthora fragariae TaxID=53985 RepID=A0A6A3FBF2_9STRA|nr:hypothetical protein PF003_g6803 [Phytophthora fragariae]KAE8943145.1 hypothetical protein PF009_g7134 [Phytophthora fragariae]KAE9089149.1 hypothetical protein PF007_g19701 [Phytophthora fragariae]KAE9150169.1 hypothetical protein PF006_g5430 [Phytophthora fragariae]KAE9178775.1 hypothetical protein PF005_g23936 [Phytophthora fragariae]
MILLVAITSCPRTATVPRGPGFVATTVFVVSPASFASCRKPCVCAASTEDASSWSCAIAGSDACCPAVALDRSSSVVPLGVASLCSLSGWNTFAAEVATITSHLSTAASPLAASKPRVLPSLARNFARLFLPIAASDFAGALESASATTFVLPGRYCTSNSYFCRLNAHRCSLPVKLLLVINHFNAA